MGEGETLRAEDLVRENENLREQRRAIGDVLRAVARSEGLQPVLDEIVSAAKQLCDGEHAQLYLAEGDLFLVSSQFADLPDGYAYAEEHPHKRDRTTVVGRAALAGEAVQIPDVLADAEYSFEGQAIVGYRALLGVPIVLDDELIGVIAVGRNVPGPFTDEQVELVKTFAETAAPEELFQVLRQYHETLGELIPAYGGTLEHFAGDGILVFFNDPLDIDDHELQAIRLAIAAQERFAELARVWRKRGTELGLGIGIEAGYATLGRIGYEGRYDYAALGPVVNLASRLSDHAAVGQILIGQHIFGAVEERVDTAPVGDLDLKGFARPVPAYEVLGLRTEP